MKAKKKGKILFGRKQGGESRMRERRVRITEKEEAGFEEEEQGIDNPHDWIKCT